MWNLSKHLAFRALAFGAFTTLTFSAAAAVDLTTAGAEGADKAVPVKADSSKSSFRCWQYGRLIFEEVGLDWPADTASHIMTLQQGAPGKTVVHLLETKDATCLFKEVRP